MTNTTTNDLTPAQDELLTLLIEECAEVIQAATKIRRFGLHGAYDNGVVNVEQLHKELGDVRAAMIMLADVKVLQLGRLPRLAGEKLARVGKYLRHYKFPEVLEEREVEP